MSWVNLAEVLRIGGEPWAERMARWLSDDISQPFPGLGRGGALCPFVPQGLRTGTIFAVLDEDTSAQRDVIAQRAHREAAVLQGVENGASLLIVFTGLGPDHGPVLANAAREMKRELLERGMSCGEFYPANDDRSVRNPHVVVARSPLPCLALRPSTTHDRLFLANRPGLLAALERGLAR